MHYISTFSILFVSNVFSQKSWNDICVGSMLNVAVTPSDIIWYPDSSINGIEIPFYAPMMPCSVLITPNTGVVMDIFLKGTNLYHLNVSEIYNNQKNMRLGIADVNILSAELTPFARPIEIDFNENVLNGTFAIKITGKPIDFNNIVNLGTDYATFEAFNYTNDVSITYSAQSNVVVFLSSYNQQTLGNPVNTLMFFQQKSYITDFTSVWNVSKNEYGISPYQTLSNSITFYYDYNPITKFNGQAVIYAPSSGLTVDWNMYVSSSWDDMNLHLGNGKTIGVVQRRTDPTKLGTVTNIAFTQPDGVFTIYKGVVEAQGPFYQGFPVMAIKAVDYKPGHPDIVLPAGYVFSFVIQNGGVFYSLDTTDAPPPPPTTPGPSTSTTSTNIPITTSVSNAYCYYISILFAFFAVIPV